MPVGVCTEKWILDNPGILADLQRAYADAGSQIVYAPTFSANRLSPSMQDCRHCIAEYNRKLDKLSRRAVDGRAYVAGDMTTTGRFLEPRGDMTYSELYEIYREQIRMLSDAGADLLVVETMMSLDETVVALEAAQSVCDLPVMCSLTLEADG